MTGSVKLIPIFRAHVRATVFARLLVPNLSPFPRRMFLAVLRSTRAILFHKQNLYTPVARTGRCFGTSCFSRPRGLPRPLVILVIRFHTRSGAVGAQSFLSSVAKMSEKKTFERLPTDVIPRNYAVELQPDLKKFIFTGKLAITVEVRTA